MLSTDLVFFLFVVDFADEPLKIRQTILKKRIRPAVLQKKEQNNRAISAKVSNCIKSKNWTWIPSPIID
jgi:hypothetical protein